MNSDYDKVQFHRLTKKEKDEAIRNLRKLLANERRIIVAIVFGSVTRRNSVRDIDVCVYSAPTLSQQELLKLNAEIELAMGMPVDLVELSNLSPSFRMGVLKNGILIKGKTSFLYRLMEQAQSERMNMQTELHALK